MAVIPQFLSTELPFAPQALALTVTAAAVSLMVYSIYSACAVPLGRWLGATGGGRMQNRLTGSFYFAAAGALAVAGQRPSA
jgi:threonine/homoserine/homoserine lactone efflux protein